MYSMQKNNSGILIIAVNKLEVIRISVNDKVKKFICTNDERLDDNGNVYSRTN